MGLDHFARSPNLDIPEPMSAILDPKKTKTNFHKIGKNHPKKSRFFQLEVVRFAGTYSNDKPENGKTG